MFGLFESKEDKVIEKIQDLCELWKEDDTIKNVIGYLHELLKIHDIKGLEKKIFKTKVNLIKQHWVALNFQLVLGYVAKMDDIELYTNVRETFDLDSPRGQVANLINNNYAPIYGQIVSDFAWASLGEELIHKCFNVNKTIGVQDAFNEYHIQLNNFIKGQNLNYKNFFDSL